MQQLIDKLTSGTTPTYVLVGVAILVALLAFKLVKGLLKLLFVLAALALLGGAAWWYFHHR